MTKKMLIIGLIFVTVLTLNGCKSKVQSPIEETAMTIPTFYFSDSKTENSNETVKAEATETTQNQISSTCSPKETESIADTEKVDTTIVTAKVDSTNSSNTTETVSKPTQPQKATEEKKPQTKNKPVETITHPKQETTTQKPTSEPKFDITYWTNYAKSYAQSIGLSLDSTATECWDNPITANAKRTNLQDDIVGRLNRYKNVEGFTSVWVWAEKISDTEYEIYIGYA